ncbi:MAG: response regulator, partial [Solirubrobacteraceae bacterium]|nr:response regulator [Patulibacter sp.]
MNGRTPASPARASILVVDDEPTISEVVARYLVRAGYEARVASDGARALALHSERPADLFVLD